jgi:large subunit ribosomal protein L29
LKSTEVRNMTDAEIEQKLIGLKEQLFKLRAEVTTGRVERPNRFRALRKDIARCYTILKEKNVEGK